jgi:FeS assembly SUF system regulator
MLRVSKLADYATVVMGDLATHAERHRSAAEIAARTGIALPTVSKVLKRLAHAGLVSSVRGHGGGYRLAHAARAITVAHIVRSIEAPVGITECGAGAGVCAQEAQCAIRPGWQRINRTILKVLENMTLADLTAPAGSAASLREPAATA